MNKPTDEVCESCSAPIADPTAGDNKKVHPEKASGGSGKSGDHTGHDPANDHADHDHE